MSVSPESFGAVPMSVERTPKREDETPIQKRRDETPASAERLIAEIEGGADGRVNLESSERGAIPDVDVVKKKLQLLLEKIQEIEAAQAVAGTQTEFIRLAEEEVNLLYEKEALERQLEEAKRAAEALEEQQAQGRSGPTSTEAEGTRVERKKPKELNDQI